MIVVEKQCRCCLTHQARRSGKAVGETGAMAEKMLEKLVRECWKSLKICWKDAGKLLRTRVLVVQRAELMGATASARAAQAKDKQREGACRTV